MKLPVVSGQSSTKSSTRMVPRLVSKVAVVKGVAPFSGVLRGRVNPQFNGGAGMRRGRPQSEPRKVDSFPCGLRPHGEPSDG